MGDKCTPFVVSVLQCLSLLHVSKSNVRVYDLLVKQLFSRLFVCRSEQDGMFRRPQEYMDSPLTMLCARV